MSKSKKYFPIKTATACQLKWSWSTIMLTTGTTTSCYRASQSKITAENFESFHNTPQKIKDRQAMLRGEWPESVGTSTCDYCKIIEDTGSISDRLWHQSIPDMYPDELDRDLGAVVVKPKIVEVFFNNTCQLACLYCNQQLSSTIAQENKKFNQSTINGIKFDRLEPIEQKQFRDLLPAFWNWFEKDFHSLKRFNVLGGEPFLQKELSKLLDFIDENPNPDCEFNIVSNIAVDIDIIKYHIEKIKRLLAKRKLKNLHLLASIDCWGPQQEYVRWGLDLAQWENNFAYLLDNRWIKLGILQCLSPLTIKTAPDLIEMYKGWKKIRPVGFNTGTVSPEPEFMIPKYFGAGIFEQDFARMIDLFPIDNSEDLMQKQYLEGIGKAIGNHPRDLTKIKNLLIYLDEKDRRRNTDWRPLFPWLTEFEALCGTAK